MEPGALRQFARKREAGERLERERGRLHVGRMELRERALFEELRERERTQSEAERAARFFDELHERDRLAQMAREAGDVRILVQELEAEAGREQAVEQLRRTEAMKSIFTRRELAQALNKVRLGNRAEGIEARVKRIPVPLGARVRWTPDRAKAVLNRAMLGHLLAQSAMRKGFAERLKREART
ncbi:MAG: hypothetical protein AB1626_00425 [Candidatus Micrarchaeota archaeon]